MGKKDNNENMTNSQAKRAARKAAAAKLKKQKRVERLVEFIFYAVIVAIVAVIAGAIIVNQMNKVTASNDYSACLDSNGYIEGVTASSAVNLPDYKNATVALSEIEFTDEQVEEDIKNQLESHKALNDDPELKVADGDDVNIDYVGTIDGVEFEGGAAQSYDLVIGSGSFIPGFEEQLIDAKVQSNFDINVTFPEDYSSAELAGKDAVFNITINGINEAPEFTDEFVAEYLSDKASTVEEYKQYLKDTNYESSLKTWVENYIQDNSEATSYKGKYLKNLKAVQKYEAEQGYASMDELYQMYFGTGYDGTFEDYVGMSMKEYDKSLIDTAKDSYKNNLAYQAIVELEGATADAAFYKDYLTKDGRDVTEYDSLVEQYGEPYVLQMAIKEKAIEIVKGMVSVQ